MQFEFHAKGDVMRKTMLIFTSLIFVTSVNADTIAKLYQEYEFGMSKSEIMNNSKVYDCSEEFEKDALCLDEQKFAGKDVGIGFRFIDKKLITVILFSEFTAENYLQFIGALDSKFQLTTIESGDKKIDLILQMKKYKGAKYLKNINDFEQQARSSGDIKYTFIENDSFNKLVKSSANAVEMIFEADNNIRAVEYIITEVDENTTVGFIQFSAPNKMFQLMQNKSKQKYEDF